MDGYSVKEAATVLGVPKRRVWELIARGVLSGAPEGDGGMRVFLQPRPGRGSPLSAAREEPQRTNGNGGHAEAAGEGSPFREILTEFRSLTERYGQALLALGEARGEVAALRSRVELLEARLDLRLPGPRTSSTVAWEMPEYIPPTPPAPEAPAPEAPAAAGAPDEPEAAESPLPEPSLAEADVKAAAEAGEPLSIHEPPAPVPGPLEERPEKGSSRRRRLLRSHSAIAGIAEALERAQDPTLADLPGAREAAEALAALQAEVEARTDTLEPEALVDEAAVSSEREAIAPLEPEPPAEPASEVSFVEPAAATSAQELVDEEPSVDAQPPVPVAEVAETELEPEPAEAEPELAATLEAEQTGEEPEAAGVAEGGPDRVPTAASVPSPYTTEVVEPDWFADGDFTWLEAAQAEPSNEEAEEVASGEPGPQVAAMGAPSTLETDVPKETEEAADAVPAAEAIQDAFEPAEPDAPEPEPEPAVAAENPEPEPEPVTGAVQEPEPEEAHEAPAVDAIQEAFDETFDSAEPPAHEVEPAVGPDIPEPSDRAATAAEFQPEPEASTAEEEVAAEPERVLEAEIAPDQAWRDQAAAPAEAIQDAFEPHEASGPVADTSAAIATPREEPFAPADVAVFAVDDSEPERAELPDTDAQARPPEARVEPVSTELPPAPPRIEGLGGLAVQAAALPAVQPSTPATARPQEEELMWLGDEFEAAGFEIAAPGWHSQPESAVEAAVEPAAEAPVEPATEAAVEESVEESVEASRLAPQDMTHDTPAHGMSDSDLEQIAQDEGWDADEVDAIRTLLGRPTAAQVSEDLDEQPATQSSAAFTVDSPLPPDDVHPMDEASAAPPEPAWFEEAPHEPPDAPFEAEPMPPVEWPIAEAIAPEPIQEPIAPEPHSASASAKEPARALPIEESIRQSIAQRPPERRPTAPDPEWLRRRRGPAASAYRRLRRLLPG
jgi:hypothetical protein